MLAARTNEQIVSLGKESMHAYTSPAGSESTAIVFVDADFVTAAFEGALQVTIHNLTGFNDLVASVRTC